MFSIPFLLVLVPLLSLAIGFTFDNTREKPIFFTSIAGIAINFLLLTLIGVQWLASGMDPIFVEGPVIFHSAETDIALDLYLDLYSLVYLFTATFIMGVVLVFSRTYVHREKGYKRFFNNLKFFYFGLVLVLMSGNLETLFMGWEVLGATSFFLIAFYRGRYLPVKNALKVVSLYRVADIALLLGIWVCHHYFGFSINFNDLEGWHRPQPHILSEDFYTFFIPFIFLLAAMVKSAQVPFSSWLPRAMEGPTTSSAVFYGSLSVHIGVFLLIRTAPFWEDNLLFQILIGAVGVLTAVVATITARVQSTIKTQIAYSSIAQIGIMFVEVALGWYILALVHLVGNALLRSHQLMISPSVLSYRIHDQYFHFERPPQPAVGGFWNKLKMSLFVLGILEFRLDSLMYRYLWMPLKKAGNALRFMDERRTYILALPPYLIGLYGVYHKELLPAGFIGILPELFGVFSLIFILKAFVERKSALNAWVLIIINQLYLSLAFGFNEAFDFGQVHIFLSGIFIASGLGIWVINQLRKKGEVVTLDQFSGHSHEHPRLSFIFAIAALGLAGFPITPTFIGEDLMLGHVHENQFPLLMLVVLSLILDGLVIFRIYSRLFMGPHTKGYHEVAHRSS